MSPSRASHTLQEALSQIGEIRAQMAEATLFRGYRAITVAATGVLGILAALVQAALIPDPEAMVVQYAELWVGTAALSLALQAISLARRYLTTDSELARRDTLQAVEKFAPCVLAGGLITAALLRFAPASAPLLPGLWAAFFSLGVFSSWRKLPRPCLLIGAFYLLAGVALVAAAKDGRSLSPYGMGITFGVGQLATAGMLYLTLERRHATVE